MKPFLEFFRIVPRLVFPRAVKDFPIQDFPGRSGISFLDRISTNDVPNQSRIQTRVLGCLSLDLNLVQCSPLSVASNQGPRIFRLLKVLYVYSKNHKLFSHFQDRKITLGADCNISSLYGCK